MGRHSAPKVVVVTGGSAGVGRATVRAFARAGSDVAIIARGQERLEDAAEEVRQMGRRAIAIQAAAANDREVLRTNMRYRYRCARALPRPDEPGRREYTRPRAIACITRPEAGSSLLPIIIVLIISAVPDIHLYGYYYHYKT